MEETNPILKAAYLLTILGAVLWGFVGTMDLNPIRSILGFSFLANLLYALIGLSGLLIAYDYFIRTRFSEWRPPKEFETEDSQ